jgi:hypothetical protein
VSRIPGIAHGWEGSVHRRSTEGEFVHANFAEQNRAGFSKFCRGRRIVVGHPVFQDRGMASRADALGHVEIFERNGNAVQRPTILAGSKVVFRLFRVAQGEVSR